MPTNPAILDLINEPTDTVTLTTIARDWAKPTTNVQPATRATFARIARGRFVTRDALEDAMVDALSQATTRRSNSISRRFDAANLRGLRTFALEHLVRSADEVDVPVSLQHVVTLIVDIDIPADGDDDKILGRLDDAARRAARRQPGVTDVHVSTITTRKA